MANAINDNGGDVNKWRSHAYRQAMVNKIESTIQDTGVQFRGALSSNEIENYIYSKVNARHEYLILTAQLILKLKQKALQHSSQIQLTSEGFIDPSELTEAANALMDLVL